jgi:hypothetical protein
VSKPAIDQGLTGSGGAVSPPYTGRVKRTGDDSSSTQDVPCSDKPDDKLSDKPTEADRELLCVVEAWASLSPALRSAILAIVRASTEDHRR